MVLPTDTQQKQERDVTTSKGFEKAILANEQLQTYALDQGHRKWSPVLLTCPIPADVTWKDYKE
jgi:hypothetical protein